MHPDHVLTTATTVSLAAGDDQRVRVPCTYTDYLVLRKQQMLGEEASMGASTFLENMLLSQCWIYTI